MGASSAVHTHVCPLMTSKALALGFLPMQKLVVFALVLQRVWRPLAFVRPLSLLRLAWGKCATLRMHRCSGPKGTISESSWSIWASSSWGLWGLARHQESPEGGPQTKARGSGIWKHFGNADARGYQTPTCSMAWERYKRLHL